jgi:arginine utilization regulatory protein
VRKVSTKTDDRINLEHLSADLKVVLDSINEGVHIVDASGVTVFYNRVAAALDNLDPAEVEGRHILTVFPSLSEDTSTLLAVLRTGRAAEVRQQTFTNYKGDSITTINSTLPIYSGAKLIGAIEVSRDVTLVRDLAERIVDLQAQLVAESSGRSERMPAHRAGAARFQFSDIVASSPGMLAAISKAQLAAAGNSAVLVCGETGTGKELFVQSIHNASPRRSKPFIAQNCAALPETLLEGILFGTAKGAFTGAHDRPGLFEVASEGSIFLDEVDAMPMNLQAKLLRTLQEGTVRRIGEARERSVDVRVLSSTSVNPVTAVEAGSLRRDLFYRLGVIVIEIPPLRERGEDIRLLVERFVRRYAQQFNVKVEGVSPEVMRIFADYSWPGNVRELQHAIEGAVQLLQGSCIGVEHLPPHIAMGNGAYRGGPGAGTQRAQLAAARLAPSDSSVGDGRQASGSEEEARCDIDLVATLDLVETNMITRALAENGNNVSAAARSLGLPRQTLQNRMKRLGIKA